MNSKYPRIAKQLQDPSQLCILTLPFWRVCFPFFGIVLLSFILLCQRQIWLLVIIKQATRSVRFWYQNSCEKYPLLLIFQIPIILARLTTSYFGYRSSQTPGLCSLCWPTKRPCPSKSSIPSRRRGERGAKRGERVRNIIREKSTISNRAGVIPPWRAFPGDRSS